MFSLSWRESIAYRPLIMREKGKPLFRIFGPVQGAHFEVEEVFGLEHLGQGSPRPSYAV